MKGKILKSIIFSWTILSFLIDFYMLIISQKISSGFGMSAVAIELLTCWIAYKMVTGKQWALIIVTIFYGIRTINIHLNNISFYTESGLNFEFGIGTAVSINLITLFFFVLLIFELTRSDNGAS
ncbi:MAG TPA: hypothetical protein VNG53_08455 [Bacteroidia bacterium]|nr:hypothetical protein [Bacteroidia bacterium]